MNNSAKISVIVPIYKVEAYLERCIKSIVEQTYHELEIILVDDGSPDHCPEICDQWAKKDERIKVIHKKNGGLSDARNVGLAIASGKYIGYVDSDDFIQKNMYEVLLNNLVKANADLSICGVQYVDDSDDAKAIYMESPLKKESISREQALEKLGQNGWWNYVTAWNKLYTRKSLKEVIFPYGKIHEDQFTIHQIFNNCDLIVCTDEKLYNYVQRADSIMTHSAAVRHLDDVEALCKRIEYYKDNSYSNLLDGARTLAREKYEHYRKKIDVHNLNEEEKAKVNQIDNLFKEKYLIENDKVAVKDKIKYSKPNIYFEIKRNYDRLHLKRRVRVVKAIAQYMRKTARTEAILLDTPTHINLGDHAIVLAEQQVLTQCEIKSYELTATQINSREAKYAAVTPKNQCILVHGGGFLGSLWPNEEERFRRILQAFNKQKIIVFPQTVTFDTTTPEGRKYLEESQQIYASHPDLTIFVREKRSYAFMQQYFPTVRCLLVPDIVTLLKVSDTAQTRKGILFCMRRDLEKSLDDAAQQEMLAAVQTQYPDEAIEFTDTVIDHDVMPENREEEVNKKLTQFSGARLIVTDRLHGMVFAALTNTPCIAMSNSNGKVKAVYEWIKDNDYIHFANSVAEFKQQLQALDVSQQYVYDRKLVEHEFEPLFEEIRKLQK